MRHSYTRLTTNHTPPMTYDALLLIIPWTLVFMLMTYDIFFNNDY